MSPVQIDPIIQTNQFELDVYGKRPLCLERGRGSWLWDDQGRRYLDCIAGLGSVNLGHSHPAVLTTLRDQANKLMTCPGSFYNQAKMTYLEDLIRSAPAGLNRAFLSNSGAESVEAALKFARISTGRSQIISAKGGFHGRTFGALSATFHPKYKKGFQPLVPDFHHISFNDVDQLTQVLNDQVAAIILEVVQGEGGVFPAEKAFLDRARQLCDQFGVLLIIDEVQTGFGRTGQLFACDHFQLRPDILCLAKSIANGLPMGATLVGSAIQIGVGLHGSTFGGNPLVCAVARTVLQTMIKDQIPQHTQKLGSYLLQNLQNATWQKVRHIRGKGLMIGLELRTRVQPILTQLRDEGVLALAAGATVLRLLPPLTIDQDAIDFLLEKLAKVLG